MKDETNRPHSIGDRLRRWLRDRQIPFSYEKRDGRVRITGYRDSLLPRVEIPALLGGLPVVGVGARAFVECPFLKELTFADGAEEIGANAFSSCEQLSEVHLSDSIRVIGRNAFFDDRVLFFVEFSQTLLEIESRAFYGCAGLRELTLPDSLQTIGDQAFAECRSLREIRMPLALRSVSRNIFDGCGALEAIYLERGSYADSVFSKSDLYAAKLRYIPRI